MLSVFSSSFVWLLGILLLLGWPRSPAQASVGSLVDDFLLCSSESSRGVAFIVSASCGSAAHMCLTARLRVQLATLVVWHAQCTWRGETGAGEACIYLSARRCAPAAARCRRCRYCRVA